MHWSWKLVIGLDILAIAMSIASLMLDERNRQALSAVFR